MTSWLRGAMMGVLLLVVACAPRSGSVVSEPAAQGPEPQPVHPLAWNGSASIIDPPMRELDEAIEDGDDPDAAAATLRERIADAEARFGARHTTTEHLKLMLALVLEEDGQFDAARAIYQRIEAAHRTSTASTSQPLADALHAHAIMEAKADDLAAAGPLIDEAIRIYDTRERYGNEQRITARGAAGMFHTMQRALQAAIEAHNAAVRMLPSDSRVYRDRAVTLLIAGQWRAARSDMVKVYRFRQAPIDDALPMLWLACAAAGDVERGDEVLAELLDKQLSGESDNVHAQIARHLRGEITAAELRDAAASAYAWRDRYNQCLTAYFIAHRRRADGDASGYREALATCLDTKVQACWAYHAAKRETMSGVKP